MACNVLPVLWMTHSVTPWCAALCIFILRREHDAIDSNEILPSNKGRQLHVIGFTPGGKICYLRLLQIVIDADCCYCSS